MAPFLIITHDLVKIISDEIVGVASTRRCSSHVTRRFLSYLTISNLPESVVDDVRRIRSHSLMPRYIPIFGNIYDVKSRHLVEVPEATRIGTAA